MIDISVTSKYGNTACTFPHRGFFGVTPVALSGVIHLRLNEGHPEPILPVRSVQLQIGCYEALESGPFRYGRKEHTRWETVHDLWRPKAGTQEMPFPAGHWDHAFKVRIPLEVADLTSGCKEFREWRVKWRLTVLVNHKPIPHVGHRVARSWPLELRDYRTRPTATLLPPSPPSGVIIGTGSTATRIHVNAPPSSYGPLDTVPLSVSVCPEELSTVVRKVTVVLERRLELMDRRGSSPAPDEGPPHKTSRISSIFSRSSSPRARSDDDGASSRIITMPITESQLDISSRGETGSSWCVGSLAVPQRSHRWDVGETEQTDLVDVSFVIRVKATVKSRRHTSLKELVSGPVPVVILAATAAERATAALSAKLVKQPASSTCSVSSHPDSSDDLKHKVSIHTSVPLDVSSDMLKAHAVAKSRSSSASGSRRSSPKLVAPPPPYGYRSRSRTPPVEPTPVAADDATPPTPATVTPLPSVRSIIRYTSPPPASRNSSSPSPQSTAIMSPPSNTDDPAPDGVTVVNGARRRISMTASEDHDLQPLRSRQKLWKPSELVFGHLSVPPSTDHKQRPSRAANRLPSLDALGLGLPQVPDSRPLRRPMTAPHAFGVYSAKLPPDELRPKSSGNASFAFSMPVAHGHGR